MLWKLPLKIFTEHIIKCNARNGKFKEGFSKKPYVLVLLIMAAWFKL